MRYLFPLIIILSVVVIFKDGHKESYINCIIPTMSSNTDWYLYCKNSNGFFSSYNNKISIFDIERVIET